MNKLLIEKFIRGALEEDLGHGQDITSRLTLPADTMATSVLNARENGVLAGIEFAQCAFKIVSQHLDITVHAQDGNTLTKGQAIATISGHARAIFTAERVALNCLTHMSGIATHTRAFVEQTQGTNAQICDTRKTLPYMRMMQKYAVRMGGGANHRFGLDDAVLIKDNHIAACGGIENALTRAAQGAGHTVKIEIEVDTIEQLKAVLAHKTNSPRSADIVMLDNMSLDELRECVALTQKDFANTLVLEASGGVNLQTVGDIAKTGVDMISVGALTHSAPILDIGLDVTLKS